LISKLNEEEIVETVKEQALSEVISCSSFNSSNVRAIFT